MSRMVGAILQTVAGVALTALGAPFVGIPLLLSGAQGVISGLFGPSMPKPESTETAIKTPRPPRVSAYGVRRLYGSGYWLYETATDGTAVDVYPLHDGEMSEVVAHYLNDDLVTLTGNQVNQLADKRYGDTVRMYWTSGVSPGAGFPAIAAKVPEAWSAAHRGDGVVMLAVTAAPVKDKTFLERYPNGAPTGSMAAKWQKCPNPAAPDPTDTAGWTWTENPIRQLLHYMLVRERVDYQTKIAPNLAYWIAASSVCEEDVALKAGGTEKRYRCWLAHKHTDPHKQVKAALLAACDGWMATGPNGAYIVYAGKFTAPTITIGPDEIAAFEWEGVGVDDDKAINELQCVYISAAHDYNSVDTTPWTDEDDIAERGQVLSETLDPQVPSHGQVRRLAKRRMARALALRRGTVTTTVAGRIVRGHRFINLRIEEAGKVFYDGVAEITSLTRNISTGGVTFGWVEIDANIDAWNPATEEGEPAAVGNRVAPAALDAPTIGSAAAIYFPVSDGGTGVRIEIVASGLNRGDVTWFARWREDGDVSWNEAQYPDLDPGASVTIETSFVPANTIVEVAVAYAVGDGRVSPWSATSDVDTSTDATPPDAATVPTLVSWAGTMSFEVAPIPRAGSYRWRIFEADGTTLLRTVTTATRAMSYTSAQAHADGIQRSYVVDVAGVNSGGVGTPAATAVLNKPAPAAPTTPAITGGATDATASCDAVTGASGYIVFYASTSGFNPLTEGGMVLSGLPTIALYGLAAGTFYGRIAAYDAWTSNPTLLNLSSELSFTISTGGGSTPPGGGGGGGWEEQPILVPDL